MDTSWWLLLSFLILCLTCLAALLWYRTQDARIGPPEWLRPGKVSPRDWERVSKVLARFDREKPAVYTEHHVNERARFTPPKGSDWCD